MSDIEGDCDIPDGATCQKLCEEFAAVTGTDTACAQFFLQDRQWNLDRSVSDYLDLKAQEETNNEKTTESEEGSESEVVKVDFQLIAAAMAAASGSSKELPTSLRFWSWNVDGLDDCNLMLRTKAVCILINCELPDVVHLQEVVPSTYEYIVLYLPAYTCIPGNDETRSGYFTATLLRKNSIVYEEHEVIHFHGSRMGRTMLITKVKQGTIPLTFVNCHLESTKGHAVERKKQLRSVFEKMLQHDTNRTVIFAGDLNIRDSEIQEIGGIPAGFEDVWITFGSKKELEYTWDGRRNTNIKAPGYHARFRFDRIYLRHSSPGRITLKHFGLLGIEKIPTCNRFPSDHWGMVALFDV